MVNLISDPHKISSLFILGSLDESFVNSLAKLHHIGFFSCNPLAPLGLAVQGVEVQSILRCNEATTLPSNEVLFDGFPVYIKLLRHIPSLYAIVHDVNASLNQGINDLVHQLSSVNTLPLYLSGRSRMGRGTSVRIGSMEATLTKGVSNK